MAKHSDIDPSPLKVPKAGVITAKDKNTAVNVFTEVHETKDIYATFI